MMQHSPDDRHGAVVAAYDFSASLVVDVGGGNGALLAAILGKYSDASGVLFDQEAVVAGVVLGATPPDRCRIEVGDFFEFVTPGGESTPFPRSCTTGMTVDVSRSWRTVEQRWGRTSVFW